MTWSRALQMLIRLKTTGLEATGDRRLEKAIRLTVKPGASANLLSENCQFNLPPG